MEAERPGEGDRAQVFDYSTPEAQRALEGVTELILEIRSEVGRKVSLYERTLGLAVLPVLIRRAGIVAVRRIRGTRSVRR